MNSIYTVCWNITSNCNENCKFCFRKKCKENSLKQNKEILDNLLKIKIHKLTFSGGEALLYDNLFKLVDYAKQNDPSIILSLTSNGKVIDKYLMEKIIQKFDIITFSIDSTKEDINKKIGRGKEHLSKVIELLNICNNKIDIKINTVVSKYNITELENIYEIIKKYNVSRWKILRYYPIRDSIKYKDEFYIDEKVSDNVKNIINNIKRKSNIIINYDDIKEFNTSYFNIYPDGSIENNKSEVIGNLLNTPINEILRRKKSEIINNYSRNFKKNKVK